MNAPRRADPIPRPSQVPDMRPARTGAQTPRVPVLCYHRIADLATGDRLRPFSVTPRAFARQMEWLARRGYRSVALTDLVESEGQGSLSEFKSMVLTFDDGYLDFYEVAVPILRRHGFQATVFLVSSWLGAESVSVPTDAVHFPMLSVTQMREMSRNGTAFGAHGRTHRALAQLSPREVWDEVAGSKADLERILGLPVRTFAYPYGIFDAVVRDAVKTGGYEVAVAVKNGSADLLALQRICVTREDTPVALAWKMSGWYSRLRARLRESPAGNLVRRGRGRA